MSGFGAIKGVSKALLGKLNKLGIAEPEDLLLHLPLRYVDETRITPIRELRIGESAQVEGVVEAVERGFRYRPQLRVALVDASQATLTLRFFHFSGFDPRRLTELSKHQTRIRVEGDPVLTRICREYADELLSHGFEEAVGWPYGWEAMANGVKLDRAARKVFRDGSAST